MKKPDCIFIINVRIECKMLFIKQVQIYEINFGLKMDFQKYVILKLTVSDFKKLVTFTLSEPMIISFMINLIDIWFKMRFFVNVDNLIVLIILAHVNFLLI